MEGAATLRARFAQAVESGTLAVDLAALVIAVVIALAVLGVFSALLFRGRSRNEPGATTADIQYGSAKTSGALHAGTHLALDHAEVNRGADAQDVRRCTTPHRQVTRTAVHVPPHGAEKRGWPAATVALPGERSSARLHAAARPRSGESYGAAVRRGPGAFLLRVAGGPRRHGVSS